MRKKLSDSSDEYIKAHERRSIWKRVVTVLSCFVVFCTTYALILPAITMTGDTFCGIKEHTHTDDCYEKVLICSLEEGGHQHMDACYRTELVLICKEPEGHVHTDNCYTRPLICGLEESAEHTHSDACYGEPELSCGEEAGHTHTDACWREEQTLICGEEAGHIHTDACYEKTLVCTLEEHEHSLSCYSNPEADKETASVWERTIPDDLEDNWADNLLAVARSQLGYAESTRNYLVDDSGDLKGYTRYGAWYGIPYGDWCAMYVSFCLHYAGIPSTAFPYDSGCIGWIERLTKADMYRPADKYTPQPGDIVFFDWDDDELSDHVGIYTGRGIDELDGEYIETIEGNVLDAVVETKHFLKDENIMGYGILPENPDEEKPNDGYGCGLPEHTHSDACYGTDGELICGMVEHTHDDGCRLAVTEFSYEDDEMSMLLRVESTEALDSDVSLAVDFSNDDSIYKDYASDESAQLILRNISLMQDGAALDTSAYSMTAEVEVKQTVLEPISEKLAELSDVAPETELGIVVSVLQEDDSQTVTELDSVLVAPDEAAPTLTVPVQDGTIALLAAASANPHYTVQYYAYIPRFADSGEKALTVFDTSGGILPSNGAANKTKQVYLNSTGSNTNKNAGNATANYQVATVETLTQMYTDNQFEYIKAPNTSYINKLIDNDSYTLTEVWVLKSGKSADSMEPADWNIYSPDNIHFTNRMEGVKDNVIYISDNTCIRLIYKCTEASFTTPSTFYDYDISSGQNPDGKWRTGITGINSESNYSTSRNGQRTWRSYRDVIAFGNANCGTGMANYIFGGNYLNRHSGKNYGCTFGLVDSLPVDPVSGERKIVYNEWLSAPKLFNDGDATGKHTYGNSSLTFSKTGDTYTLSAASVNGVGSIDGLQNFFHPSPYSGKIWDGILTNDFWPLDSATNRTDPNFGSYSNDVYYQGFQSADDVNGNWAAETTHFPYSDDGRAHNSFFGMQYAVQFTLTADYVGPLEYYFFGDDDMWVFLDSQLVCDIGGVHSSVGEYVNLWDYLEKGSTGTHTLTFFYTERGASGSTCYMNFTLPSVSGVNIEQKTSELRISKTVLGEDDAAKEFGFTIRFFDSTGAEILDDYAYSRYAADGTELETDLIIHDGGSFKLRAGEYVKIKYLPYGLRYTVTEQTPDGYTVTNKINGIVQSGSSASGTIIMDAANTVEYTNTLDKVGLTLQKFSPDDVPLSGAVFGLKDSSGNDVNFISTGSGSYTVPSGSADYIKAAAPDDQSAAAQYYIVSSINNDYVVGLQTSDSHPAQLQKKTGADAQKYRIYRQADGSYSFRNVANGEWLDLDKGTLNNGTLIHFYTNDSVPTGHDNQKWFIVTNTDGTVTLKPRVAVLKKSNSALDLDSATIEEGRRIQLWEGNNSGAQSWLIVPADQSAEQSITRELAVDEDGVLRISGLLPGSYTLTELTAPAGCVLLDEPVTVHISADGSVTVSGSELVTVDGSGASVVKVTNRYPDRVLTLEKQVLNKDTNRKFSFTVSYTAPGKTDVEKKLSLSSGEKADVEIPYNAEVTITEDEHDGYALSFRDGQTILPSQDGSYTFVMKQDVTVTAVNTAGYELPETGGSGTAGIYTIGVLLILAAVFLMYRKVRRRSDVLSA